MDRIFTTMEILLKCWELSYEKLFTTLNEEHKCQAADGRGEQGEEGNERV